MSKENVLFIITLYILLVVGFHFNSINQTELYYGSLIWRQNQMVHKSLNQLIFIGFYLKLNQTEKSYNSNKKNLE